VCLLRTTSAFCLLLSAFCFLLFAFCLLPFVLRCTTRVWSDLSHRLQAAVMQQVRKQRSIVEHCFTQLLDAHIAVFMLHRDVVRQSIVLHHGRMIDRDIRHALLEVRDRIPAHIHHFLQQHVCMRHGGRGIVYELSLG